MRAKKFKIGGNEMKFGLVGKTLTHSLSPKLHRIILDIIKKNGQYLILEREEDEIESTIKNCKNEGYKGLNITIPYKAHIIKYLDKLSYEACSIGAVNTVKFTDNEVIGFNTDLEGFKESIIRNNIPWSGIKVLILGTGGASKAVSAFFELNKENKIYFASQSKIKDDVLSYDMLKDLSNMDIIVNCTPCGMFPHIEEMPVTKDILKKFKYAVDLIYNPKDTLFLRCANKLGLKCLNGLDMLIYQGIKAQEIWNEIEIEKGLVDEIIKLFKKEIV